MSPTAAVPAEPYDQILIARIEMEIVYYWVVMLLFL